MADQDRLTGGSSPVTQESEVFHPPSLTRHLPSTDSSVVKVFVGKTRREFRIHKDKLCSSSRYFKGCFDANCLESQTNEIVLQESDGHDADAFRVVAEWLYDASSTMSRLAITSGMGHNAERRAQVSLTKVYIQADKLMLSQLKNDIVDKIISFSHNTLPSMVALNMLRENIAMGIHLEQYFLDCLVYWLQSCPCFLNYNENGWHIEANQYLREDPDLASMALQVLCREHEYAMINPNIDARCKYHEHNDTSPQDQCRASLATAHAEI